VTSCASQRGTAFRRADFRPGPTHVTWLVAAKVLSAWLSVQLIFCFAAIRENCEEEKSIREIGNCDLGGDVGRPGLRYETPKEIRFLSAMRYMIVYHFSSIHALNRRTSLKRSG